MPVLSEEEVGSLRFVPSAPKDHIPAFVQPGFPQRPDSRREWPECGRVPVHPVEGKTLNNCGRFEKCGTLPGNFYGDVTGSRSDPKVCGPGLFLSGRSDNCNGATLWVIGKD